MTKRFKVEIRKTCKICNKPLSIECRTYCSSKCRNKCYYLKNKNYYKKWQQKKWEETSGQYSPHKKKCKICGRWYVQVGSHIVQKHKMTAREYRESFDFPVKRGIVPKWYRKIKGEAALENKTFKNLMKGKKNRFRKGDRRAKVTTFWKGRRYKSDEFYE